MTDPSDRFVQQAFDRLFERASDAADRARKEEHGGEPEDRAFEDGRVLTFYQVIRELWLIARETGLHDRGLGAPDWHPDDVSLLRREDPEGRERIRSSLQFASRSDWEAQNRLHTETDGIREGLGPRFAGMWIDRARRRRELHVSVLDPAPDDVVLVVAAARRAGYTTCFHGARYSEGDVERFRQAVSAVAERNPSGHMGYGPHATINGVRVDVVDPAEALLKDLLSALPPDALEIDIEFERSGGWTMYAPLPESPPSDGGGAAK
jgi:hypothetical protein